MPLVVHLHATRIESPTWDRKWSISAAFTTWSKGDRTAMLHVAALPQHNR